MDEKALSELYDKFSKKLFRFILKRVKEEPLAKDILQDVFIKIQVNIHSLRDDTKLNTWVYQLTQNAVADYYRKKKYNCEIQNIEYDDDVNQKDNNIKLARCVEPFINQLPDMYREALILADIKSYTQVQIAEELGISYPAAKSRVQRARRQLKKKFTDCCQINADAYGNIVSYKKKKN